MAKKFDGKLFYGEITRSDEFYHVLYDDGDGKFCSICVSDDLACEHYFCMFVLYLTTCIRFVTWIMHRRGHVGDGGTGHCSSLQKEIWNFGLALGDF